MVCFKQTNFTWSILKYIDSFIIQSSVLPFKRQPHKMVKHTQTILEYFDSNVSIEWGREGTHINSSILVITYCFVGKEVGVRKNYIML